MQRFLKSVSLIGISLCLFFNANAQSFIPPITEGHYAAQFDFFGHHLSGIFVAKKMGENTHRVVFMSETGFQYFDFEVSDDTFIMVNCMEPLQKKGVQKLLKDDLRFLVNSNSLSKSKMKIMNDGKTHWKIAPHKKYTVAYMIQSASTENPQTIFVKHKALPVKYFFRHLPKTE